jgi:hypothetical protein
MRALFIVGILFGATAVAHAYPQYQLSRDPTCTGCHISPSGGGQLDENGLMVAASTATYGGKAEFMYGKLDPPSWLLLGGDLRGAAGMTDNGSFQAAAYPMQAEVYASIRKSHLSLELTGGLRAPQDGGSALHVPWSRQHYVMYRQHPDSPFGFYVRAGRFMPVYGLRLAEHPVYTQRYGGLPLYGEAYGGAVEYVGEQIEVHATGFVHDPIASAIEHGDGGALYVEKRLTKQAAVGVEAKYSSESDLTTTYGGIIGKLYLDGADVLLQTEIEYIHRKVTAGGVENAIAAYLIGTHPLATGWLLDVGVGHYQKNLDVSDLYRDCLDVNVHWFTTPHVELLLTLRAERLGIGPTGGYALAQLHYRL